MRGLNMNRISLVVVVMILSMLLAGCSEDPGKVITSYYTSIASGKLDEAMSCLSKNSKQMLELAGGKSKLPDLVDEFKKHKTIKSVDVTKSSVKGDRALVVYTFNYTDGSKLDSEGFLVKEDGKWKIVLK